MNLDCPELIAEYHKRTKKPSEPSEPADSNKRVTQETMAGDASKKVKRTNEYGYSRGLDVEKILGATDVYGELMFL